MDQHFTPRHRGESDSALLARHEKEKADARALWAVRVLDAWRSRSPTNRTWRMHGLVVVGSGPPGCWVEEFDPEPGVDSAATNHGGSSEDAARIAAAEALVAEDPSLEMIEAQPRLSSDMDPGARVEWFFSGVETPSATILATTRPNEPFEYSPDESGWLRADLVFSSGVRMPVILIDERAVILVQRGATFSAARGVTRWPSELPGRPRTSALAATRGPDGKQRYDR